MTPGSPLASVAAARDEPRDPRRLAREAWHRDRVLCARPEWISDPIDRQHLERLADKLFGPGGAT